MGKESRETKKTVKGLEGLDYIEIKHVPMTIDAEFGNLIDSSVIEQMEHLVARELITERIPIRGLEVKFFRSIFAMSQREFAEKLGLSHVSVFKWEKSKNKHLDVVNEIAVKVLIAGLLGLKIPASIETFVGHREFPEKLVVDFAEIRTKHRRKIA